MIPKCPRVTSMPRTASKKKKYLNVKFAEPFLDQIKLIQVIVSVDKIKNVLSMIRAYHTSESLSSGFKYGLLSRYMRP